MAAHKDTTFRFKRFSLSNHCSAMKVGTDGVLLGAWAPVGDGSGPLTVVDAGAGTGLISLMIAQRAAGAKITAVEIDPEAAAEAAVNVAASPWAERVKVVCADIAAVASRFAGVDLIVSNPPFFNTATVSPRVARAAARHEGSLGISFLMEFAASALSPSGRLAIVAPADRTPDVELQAALRRLAPERVTDVVTVSGKTPKRRLWQFARSAAAASPTVSDTLVLKTPDGGLTDVYRSLTADFYL